MSPPRRAILFVAWGEACVREVLDLRRESVLPPYPLFLLTDRESIVPDTEGLEVLRADFVLEGKLRKAEMLDHLPAGYDSLLFLDSDIRVLGDLELGFAQAERHGLALALAPHCSLDFFLGFGEVMDLESMPRRGQAQYNTGVLFFRRGPDVDRILRLWKERCLAHRERPHSDQPYFTLVLEELGFRPYVLSSAYNYRGVGEVVSGPVRIWHCRDPRPARLNAPELVSVPRRILHGEILLPAGPPLPGARAIHAAAVLALAIVVVLLARPGALVAAATVLAALALLVVARGTLVRRSRLTKVLLLLTGIVVLLVLPELALRRAGLRFEAGAHVGPPRAREFFRFAPDPELLWTLDPRDPGVNSWGFPDEEVADPAPAGTTRLLFLGDSCMAQGYPARVEERLARSPDSSPGSVEAIVLAVQGYSSLQGVRAAARHAAHVAPDVALVAFGWNDHWRSIEVPDARRTASGAESGPRLPNLLRRSRLVQWIVRSWSGAAAERRIDAPRVSLSEYEANLERLRSRFASTDIPVVLLTAPTAHPVQGVPDYLVEEGYITDAESGLRLHREYNEVVRRVAARPGAHLLDLAARYAALPAEDVRRLFRADGIHFTEEGLGRVAEDVTAFLVEAGLVD